MAESPLDRATRLKNEADAADAVAAAKLRLAEGTDKIAEARLELAKTTQAVTEAELALASAQGITGAALDKAIKDNEKAKQRVEDLTKAQQDNTEALKAGEAAAKRYTDALGTISEALFGISGQWKQSTTGALTHSEALEQRLGPAYNFLGSVMTQVVESTHKLTMGFDEASVSLNKSTGMASQFADQMEASEFTLRTHGVGIAEVGKAYDALITNYGQFDDLTETQQKELADTSALLDKFTGGVLDVSKSLGVMTAAMDMSANSAADVQAEMFLFLQDAGVPTSKILADFEGHTATMAKFGDTGPHVFKELSVAAHESNMELGQLISIVEKFDRFDSAADSVGRLNALLGGPFLNSLQMVTATDPIDRLQMLQGALDDSGKSFNDMSYYERQAIADAAGLKDVGELALLMSGNFEHLAESGQLTQEQYEELANQSADFNTVMEELRQTMQMFAINLAPLISGLKTVATWLQALPEDTRWWIGALTLLGFVVAVAIKGFISFAASAATVGTALGVIGGTAPPAAAGVGLLSAASTAGIGPILALGMAAFMVGGAVFLAGLGLSYMFAEIANANVGAMLGAAGALLALAGAVNLLSFPAAAVGAVTLAAIAASISLMASFISPLVAGLAEISGNDFAMAASGMRDLVTAMNDLPEDKTVKLTTAFEAASAYEASAALREAGTGGAGAASPVSRTPLAQKVNVEISFSERAGEVFVADVVREEFK